MSHTFFVLLHWVGCVGLSTSTGLIRAPRRRLCGWLCSDGGDDVLNVATHSSEFGWLVYETASGAASAFTRPPAGPAFYQATFFIQEVV